MKFLRNPKAVVAQRSRARHLAHKRRPKPAPVRSPDEFMGALLRLSPIAMRDYIEWLRSQPTEESRETHNDAGTETPSGRVDREESHDPGA